MSLITGLDFESFFCGLYKRFNNKSKYESVTLCLAITLIFRALLEKTHDYHQTSGQVHLDLAPRNIKIENRKGIVKAKLMDFGSARYFDEKITIAEGEAEISEYSDAIYVEGEAAHPQHDIHAVATIMEKKVIEYDKYIHIYNMTSFMPKLINTVILTLQQAPKTSEYEKIVTTSLNQLATCCKELMTQRKGCADNKPTTAISESDQVVKPASLTQHKPF